ncbi:MAG: ABC transporter ATP-binding protein [Actinomycetota bacterium]
MTVPLSSDQERDVVMAPAGIVGRGLRRVFGSVVAVDHLDITVTAGKVTALVGPNGSGKTTLMLMMAGLLAPDAGTLTIAGANPITQSDAVRAAVGWMPDVLGSWDTLTCREVLTTFADTYRLPRDVGRARADSLLADLHLDDLAHSPARVLSRGQKQRLGLARALIHNPQVLLLDEPASGLDPRSRVDLRLMLRRLAGEGKAVLISSHVLSELDDLADDAVFVSRGRTVDAQTLHAMSNGTRRWALSSLDTEQLHIWLQEHNVVEVTDPETARVGEIHIDLPSRESAAELLRDIVRDGIPLVSLAPAAGALEQVYLGLEHDRR